MPAAKTSKEKRGICNTRENSVRKCHRASASSIIAFGSIVSGLRSGRSGAACAATACDASGAAFTTVMFLIISARTGNEYSSRGDAWLATFSSSCTSRCRLRVFTWGATAARSWRLRVLCEGACAMSIAGSSIALRLMVMRMPLFCLRIPASTRSLFRFIACSRARNSSVRSRAIRRRLRMMSRHLATSASSATLVTRNRCSSKHVWMTRMRDCRYSCSWLFSSTSCELITSACPSAARCE